LIFHPEELKSINHRKFSLAPFINSKKNIRQKRIDVLRDFENAEA
jgi:hypothetical protein